MFGLTVVKLGGWNVMVCLPHPLRRYVLMDRWIPLSINRTVSNPSEVMVQ
jgi:hypothetical protein